MDIEILTDSQLEALLGTIDEILQSRTGEHLQGLEALLRTIDEILQGCAGEHSGDTENGEGIGSGT